MNHETRRIQVWPSGDGYEYRGDPFGPPHERTFRRNERCGEEYGVWFDADADPREKDWQAIRVELLVERYIDREILKCDSMLVSSLLGAGEGLPQELAEEWSYDTVTGLYPDPREWTAEECWEWLESYATITNETSDDCVEDLQASVQEHAEPAEIFEWWAVTEWLAEQLTAIGEPVLDNAYGYWWGRTCTGQAMKMDGTLQRIAQRHA